MIAMLEKEKPSDGVDHLLWYVGNKNDNMKRGEKVINTGKRGELAETMKQYSAAITEGEYGMSNANGFGSVAVALGDNGVARTSANNSIASATGPNGTACAKERHSVAVSTGLEGLACTAGVRSFAVADGFRSRAVAEGDFSLAVASGYQSSATALGAGSIAMALGDSAVAKGRVGTMLIFAERDNWGDADLKIKNFLSVRVDGETVLADTPYMLVDGRLTRVAGKTLAPKIAFREGNDSAF